jgi:hypothetical protein
MIDKWIEYFKERAHVYENVRYMYLSDDNDKQAREYMDQQEKKLAMMRSKLRPKMMPLH